MRNWIMKRSVGWFVGVLHWDIEKSVAELASIKQDVTFTWWFGQNSPTKTTSFNWVEATTVLLLTLPLTIGKYGKYGSMAMIFFSSEGPGKRLFQVDWNPVVFGNPREKWVNQDMHELTCWIAIKSSLSRRESVLQVMSEVFVGKLNHPIANGAGS